MTGHEPDRGAALEAALAKLGVTVTVRLDGAMAILTPRDGDPFATLEDPARREAALGAARALGLTHLALSLQGLPDVRAEDGGRPD